MRILHYCLGLPPYRSGGLTKYATDLMVAQSASGDIVSLLYPGDYTFWQFSKTRIIGNESFNGVSVYEIENPSIVPLLHGVSKPSAIFEQKQTLSELALEQFYLEVKPEVMHIHTLMGLPPELVLYFRGKGVKIIFTSHDYYGLCLKVNFINHKGVYCNMPGKVQCAICNIDAPGSLFLRLRNSKYFLKYKEKLSSGSRKLNEFKNKYHKEESPTRKQNEEYAALLEFYLKLFELVDCFHFNSTISKEVYENYLTPKHSVVLQISHADICDNRRLKTFDKKHIRLGFIGSTASYKGFPMLKKTLCELNNKGIQNWTLQVWGRAFGVDPECDKICYKGIYMANEMVEVFNQMDLLVVPSVWKETFSLITLEALSNGVPVLVSNNVGAKDIVNGYNPDFVFHPTKESLQTKLELIFRNPIFLEDFNKKICLNKFEYSFNNHAQKIKNLYTVLITNKDEISHHRNSRSPK